MDFSSTIDRIRDRKYFKMDIFELKKLAHQYMLEENWRMEMKIRRVILTKDETDAVGWYQFAVLLNDVGYKDLSERCYRLAFSHGYPRDGIENLV